VAKVPELDSYSIGRSIVNLSSPFVKLLRECLIPSVAVGQPILLILLDPHSAIYFWYINLLFITTSSRRAAG
jgi:hypothetical protein